MLVYEYKLRLSRTQAAAIKEAIRTTQFIRNKAVRLWMDGRSVSANDLQVVWPAWPTTTPSPPASTRRPARPPPRRGPGKGSSATARQDRCETAPESPATVDAMQTRLARAPHRRSSRAG